MDFMKLTSFHPLIPRLNSAFASVALVLLAATLAPHANAQISPQASSALNDLYGKGIYRQKSFGPARWIDGGTRYTTVEPSATAPKGQEIVEYDTATGARKILVAASALLPPGAKAPLSIDDYSWSPDNKQLLLFTNSKRVWRLNTRGDYWLLDLATGKLHKLGGDSPESTMMFAKFSPDGKNLAFVRASNIYVQDLATDAIHALTTNGTDTLINGTSDWVNEEELNIRDGFTWSPDSKSIAYWQFDTTGVGMFTLINDTAEEYPTVRTYPYPQPGTTNSAVRVGVVSAQGGATQWMKLPGDPRQHYVASIAWMDDSTSLLLQYLNRKQNANEVLRADAATGDIHDFFEDTDKAWVEVADRFGAARVVGTSTVRWVNHGKGLLWLSERDGWRHAYIVDRTTGQPQLITHFDGDVMSEAAIDEHGGWFYFTASLANATQRYLYRVHLDGSSTAPERITPQDLTGSNDYNIAPNGAWAFHTRSTFNSPAVIDLVHLPDHKVTRILETNTELATKVAPIVSTTPSEFFQVPVSNHVTLDGWMIKPSNFDPAKKYPVLVYVYGEPAGATVTDRWSNQRLFFAAIANEGYIVASFDNQGTPAPKGREWRKAVYGAVGVLSAAQQAEAIRELGKEHSYIDLDRLAIWGHSGGGSNTLNLMFRSNGLFKTGIALAPVADESHYDTIYQERYMGLPQENVQGYHDGSPINFAEGLQGHLLIMHGSGDDNVHYQGTELLINKLIELGKQFDFIEYPNRTHGLSEGKGTSLHVYTTLLRYLEEHTPAGAASR